MHRTRGRYPGHCGVRGWDASVGWRRRCRGLWGLEGSTILRMLRSGGWASAATSGQTSTRPWWSLSSSFSRRSPVGQRPLPLSLLLLLQLLVVLAVIATAVVVSSTGTDGVDITVGVVTAVDASAAAELLQDDQVARAGARP